MKECSKSQESHTITKHYSDIGHGIFIQNGAKSGSYCYVQVNKKRTKNPCTTIFYQTPIDPSPPFLDKACLFIWTGEDAFVSLKDWNRVDKVVRCSSASAVQCGGQIISPDPIMPSVWSAFLFLRRPIVFLWKETRMKLHEIPLHARSTVEKPMHYGAFYLQQRDDRTGYYLDSGTLRESQILAFM